MLTDQTSQALEMDPKTIPRSLVQKKHIINALDSRIHACFEDGRMLAHTKERRIELRSSWRRCHDIDNQCKP